MNAAHPPDHEPRTDAAGTAAGTETPGAESPETGPEAWAGRDFAVRELPGGLIMRRGRTSDVPAIRRLVAPMVAERILVAKQAVNYYEGLHEFRLIVDPSAPDPTASGVDGTGQAGAAPAGTGRAGAGRVIGCAALHVLWEDLAEARTVATDPDYRGRGVGRMLMEQLLADARAIGVSRVFCLTFETRFFASLGFEEITGTPVSPEVYVELLHSHDENTAEFLDLARVKPNTLGNTRMMKHL